MYYARRAEPKASKLLFKKETERRQELHRQKLRSMKPSIDNKAPRRFKHMKRNLKKEQMMEDRYAQIERENRILLSKMSEIMQGKNTLDNKCEAAMYSHSLNREQRKRELTRITAENQAILARIQTREPVYDRYKWEEERIANERYLANIREYKPRSDPSTHGTSRMVSGVLESSGAGVGAGAGGIDSLDPEYARASRERLMEATADDEDHFPDAPTGGRGGTLAPLDA